MQENSYVGKKAPRKNELHIFCQQQNYVKYKAVPCASCYAREVYSLWKTAIKSISKISIKITVFQGTSDFF